MRLIVIRTNQEFS